MALKARVPQLKHLTMGECLEIKVKQYRRAGRRLPRQIDLDDQLPLLAEAKGEMA
jgi:hypothetical protein